MSKRKPMRFREARSKSKVGSKAARSGQRQRSKQAQVLALLRGPSGATIASVMSSTSWQQHTVRAFLAAVVRKKLGLKLESEKVDGERGLPPLPRVCRVRSLAVALDRPFRDRGRDRAHPVTCA